MPWAVLKEVFPPLLELMLGANSVNPLRRWQSGCPGGDAEVAIKVAMVATATAWLTVTHLPGLSHGLACLSKFQGTP